MDFTLSVIDQAEAVLYFVSIHHWAWPDNDRNRIGETVPLDLRILRILLPANLVSITFSIVVNRTGSRIHTSDNLDLRDTVRISEDDTNLGWGGTLLCELADLVNNLLWGGLEPRRSGARVWNS